MGSRSNKRRDGMSDMICRVLPEGDQSAPEHDGQSIAYETRTAAVEAAVNAAQGALRDSEEVSIHVEPAPGQNARSQLPDERGRYSVGRMDKLKRPDFYRLDSRDGVSFRLRPRCWTDFACVLLAFDFAGLRSLIWRAELRCRRSDPVPGWICGNLRRVRSHHGDHGPPFRR